MKVSIYIKTEFHGNPRGRGRSASIMEYVGQKVHTKEGMACEGDTKNALELRACVDALKSLNRRCEVEVFLDNAYIRNAVVLGWLDSWKENGWEKPGGGEPANTRLWKDFYLLSHAMHQVSMRDYEKKYDMQLDRLLSAGEEIGDAGSEGL